MKITFKTNTLGQIEIDTDVKPQINEALDKSDFAEMEKFFNKLFKESLSDIEKTVQATVKKEMGTKATEQKIVDIARNCIIQLYKTLWVRRASWANGIKNERA